MRHRTDNNDAPCEHDHGGNDIHYHLDGRSIDHIDGRRIDHDHGGNDINDDDYHDAVDHDDLVKRINDDYLPTADDDKRDDHTSYDDAGNVIDHDNIRAAIVDVNNARGTYDYLPAVRTLVDTAAAVLAGGPYAAADDPDGFTAWNMRAYIAQRARIDSIHTDSRLRDAARAVLDVVD